VGDNRPVTAVTILGSTGSIGTQAIEVIDAHPGAFQVTGIAAGGTDPAALAAQARHLRAGVVAVADPAAVPTLRAELGSAVQILAGPDAATELAAQPTDVVLNGITGSIGLRPTLAALEAGTTLALANKESLVVGGHLVTAAATRANQIVPVDSEHSAIAQCLRSGSHGEVRRIILTASGGPFRGWTRAQLASVTPVDALAHPTWQMGPVVTVNSATLVNKALELIEAHLLFEVPAEDIVVVVHPQSVVHSMVEFVDGATIAQASPPDMRLPIALGLTWPDRLEDVSPPCTWSEPTSWTFEPLDDEVFGAVELARTALAAGGTHPAVFNAANEECVAAFLAGTIPFPAIVDTVAELVGEHQPQATPTLDDVLAAEAWARRRTHELLSAVRGKRWQP
jgi:1-deoxy-D-xylulose-5-phosphate reductoisomerase